MVKDGTFKAGEFYGGLDDGTVSLAPFNKAVPGGRGKSVEEKREADRGALDYWKGPLKDNQGKEVVARTAQTLAIADINGMKWLVEGVDRKDPEQIGSQCSEAPRKAGSSPARCFAGHRQDFRRARRQPGR